MSKLRSVNTGFWDDEYVGELSRDEQHLFLYFLTNPLTNMAGAYKIARKVIKGHTGFTDDELDTILRKFEKDQKVTYRDGWVVLRNWLKNQSLNDNMKKGVINDISDAPAWVCLQVVDFIRKSRTLSKAFEGFQRMLTDVETLRKDEVESEREVEEESEGECCEREVMLGTVLTQVKEDLGVRKMSNVEERSWLYYADLAFENGFLSADFLECLKLLKQQKWRNGPVDAEQVHKNIGNLPKLRDEIANQDTKGNGRKEHPNTTALREWEEFGRTGELHSTGQPTPVDETRRLN